MITKIGEELLQELRRNCKTAEKSDQKGIGVGWGLASGVAAAKATSLGSLPVVLPVAHQIIMKDKFNSDKDITPGQMRKIKSILGADKVKLNGVALYNNTSAGFNPLTREVYAVPNSYVHVHELGHATGLLGKNRVGGTIASLFTHGIGRKMAPVIRGANSAHKAYNREMGIDPENDSKFLDYSSKASQLASAGMLAEEGQASLRALNAIRKVQGNAGMLRAAKLFAPAYSTYLAAALGAHAIAPRVGEYIGKARAKHIQSRGNRHE